MSTRFEGNNGWEKAGCENHNSFCDFLQTKNRPWKLIHDPILWHCEFRLIIPGLWGCKNEDLNCVFEFTMSTLQTVKSEQPYQIQQNFLFLCNITAACTLQLDFGICYLVIILWVVELECMWKKCIQWKRESRLSFLCWLFVIVIN